MAEKSKPSVAEKAATIYRDFNMIGTVAMLGAGILAPPLTAATMALAGVNALQAAGGEWARRVAQKNRLKRA